MKKTYIQPHMRVAHLNPVQMLCTSGPTFKLTDDEYSGTDGIYVD